MTALFPTEYNAAGDLLASSSLMIKTNQLRNRASRMPSFEVGQYHYFEIVADDVPSFMAKLRRFVTLLDAAPGRGSVIRYTEGRLPALRADLAPRYVARILYVVER